MAITDDSGKAATEEEKAPGILGRVFGGGGKKVKKAKMGLELQMYYHEEVGPMSSLFQKSLTTSC